MKTIKLSGFALVMALSVGFFASCSDSNDPEPTPLPPIGGFASADEVGAANLMAYWPLNGNGTEAKSNTAPSKTQGATWVEGAKGQAVSFTDGYLDYPAIAALSTTSGSITVSLWAKISNNGGEGANGHPTALFSLTRPDEWAGNVNFMSETGWAGPTSDSLTVKGLVVINKDGSGSFQDSRNTIKASPEDIATGQVPSANKNGGKWAQYVMTWDGSNAMFQIYANGVKISNPSWESRNGGSSMPLNFFTPTHPIIGAFGNVATTTDSWNAPMTGQVDEIRVWNKVLTGSDIGALYELEKAGR